MLHPFSTLLLLLPSDGDEGVRVSAELATGALVVGATSELRIHFELAAGWTVAPNPLLAGTEPRLFVQLAPPLEIELTGPSAITLPELLRARFLDLPFERVLPLGDSALEFRVLSTPAAEVRFAFNALAYVRPSDAPNAHLVRLRFELALAPGARAVAVPSTDSRWGSGAALRLGERAPAFELPTASGTPLAVTMRFLVLSLACLVAGACGDGGTGAAASARPVVDAGVHRARRAGGRLHEVQPQARPDLPGQGRLVRGARVPRILLPRTQSHLVARAGR